MKYMSTKHWGTVIKSRITVTKILFSINGAFCLRIIGHNYTLLNSVSISLLSSFYLENNIILIPNIGVGTLEKIFPNNATAYSMSIICDTVL
jgi:hypothetical protein